MTNIKKRTIITNKRRFFTFLLLMAICANIAFIYVCMPKNTQADTLIKTQSVTVCAGDTLWSLANEHCKTTDVRNTVYKIKKMNDLKSSELSVGQELLIPIF